MDRDGWRDGSWDSRDDQPSGVSPSPCRNMRAAGFDCWDCGPLVVDDTGLVDMARMVDIRRKEDDRIMSFGRRWSGDNAIRLCIVCFF